jgi:hypothetical protein
MIRITPIKETKLTNKSKIFIFVPSSQAPMKMVIKGVKFLVTVVKLRDTNLITKNVIDVPNMD